MMIGTTIIIPMIIMVTIIMMMMITVIIMTTKIATIIAIMTTTVMIMQIHHLAFVMTDAFALYISTDQNRDGLQNKFTGCELLVFQSVIWSAR